MGTVGFPELLLVVGVLKKNGKDRESPKFVYCRYFSSLKKLFYSGKVPEIKFSLDNVCFLFCFERNSHQSCMNSLERYLPMLWTTYDFSFVSRFQSL